MTKEKQNKTTRARILLLILTLSLIPFNLLPTASALVWNTGVTFNCDNEYYSVTTPLTVDNVSVSTHWFSVNGIGYNVSYAGTKYYANFSSIKSSPKSPSTTGFIINWTAQKQTGNIAYHTINGLKPNYGYLLYNNLSGTFPKTSTASGTITINMSAPYTNIQYKIEDLGIPAAFYVATTGSDSTGTGAIGNPFKTLRKAINASTTSDDIIIRGGTYNWSRVVVNRSGTTDDWYTISNYPGETVIIQSNQVEMADDNATIWIRGQSYIQISGVTIRNSRCYGITVRYPTSHHLRFDNLTIYNCSASGIYVYKSGAASCVANVSVENCTVYNINNKIAGYNAQEAISFSGVTNFTIKDNIVYGCGKEGIDMKSGSNNGSCFRNDVNTSGIAYNGTTYDVVGIYVDGFSLTCSDINVYNNYVHGNSTCYGVCAEQSSGKIDDVYLYNNIGYKTGTDNLYTNCLWVGTSGGTPGTVSDLYIYHNTFIDTIYSGAWNGLCVAPQPSTDYTNVVIKNNIFAGTQNYYMFNAANTASTSGRIILTYNCFYRYGGTTRVTWSDGTNPADGTTRIMSDPEVGSITSPDFTLNLTSPCIGAATSSLVATTDYAGTSRPQGGTYDIGAYEYIGGGGTAYAPVQSTPIPSNGSSSVSLPLARLNITATDQNADTMDIYFRSNHTGAWATLGSNLTVANGTYSVMLPGFTGTSKIWWSVNITDSSVWTNRTYWFLPSYPTEGITLNSVKANWTTSTSIYLSWTKGANTTNTYVYRSETGYLTGASLIYSGTNAYYNDTLKDPTIRYYYTLKPYNSVSSLFGTPLNVTLAETDTDTNYGASWLEFKGYLTTDKNVQVRYQYSEDAAFGTINTNNTILETGLYNTTGRLTGFHYFGIYGANWKAQTFTTGTTRYYVYNVTTKLIRTGSPGQLFIRLYSANTSTGKPSGAVLASGSRNANTISTTTGEWFNVTMSSYNLLTNTRYVIVLYLSGGSTANCLDWYVNQTPGYNLGQLMGSSDSGSTYSNYTGYDGLFKIYANEPTSYPSGQNTSNTTKTTSGTIEITQGSLNPGTIYYYRLNANDTKGNTTRGNTRYSLTNPDIPIYQSITPYFSNSTIYLTWTKGTGANNTIIRYSTSSYPTTPTEGDLLYNGTGTSAWLSVSFNTSYKISLFSFTVWGSLSRYSASASVPWGGCSFNCYNESSGLPIKYNVLISNQQGDQTYYGPSLEGWQFINTTEIPMGTNIGFYVSGWNNTNQSYYSRMNYHTILPDIFYNFSFYLPPTTTPQTPEDENESYLYYLRVQETVYSGDYSYDRDVQDVKILVKRYIIASGEFVTVASMLTDAAGMVNVYLVPNAYYKIFLNKSGYEDSTNDYIPMPPNEWGQTDTKYFKITALTGTEDNETVLNPRNIRFNAVLNGNSSVYVSFNASVSGDCVVTLYISEYYNFSTYLNATYNFTSCNQSFYYSPVNISRGYMVSLYMNFTDDTGGEFHYIKYLQPLLAALYNGSAIEEKISNVWGAWTLGYVNAFIIYGGFLFFLIAVAVGTKEPGYGAVGGGLWLAFSNSLITGLNLINIFEVAAFCCAIGFLLLFLHWRKAKA